MLSKTKATLSALVFSLFMKTAAPVHAQTREESKPAKISFDATAWLKTQYANMRGWAPWQAPVTQIEANLRYGNDKTGISLYYWENRGYQFKFGQLTEWDLCLIADHAFSQRLSATAGFNHYSIPEAPQRPQGIPGMKLNLTEWFVNGNYSIYQSKGILKDVSLTLTYYDDFSKDSGGKILEAGISGKVQVAFVTISARIKACGNDHYFTDYAKMTGIRSDVNVSIPIAKGFLFNVNGRYFAAIQPEFQNHFALGVGVEFVR